jgi:hypothetical protein
MPGQAGHLLQDIAIASVVRRKTIGTAGATLA